MKRKFTALLCSLVLLCVAFVSPFSALAADSSASGTFSVDAKCPTCGGALTYKWWSTLGAEVELKIINNAMVSIPSGSGSLGKLTERCESCGYEKTEWKCLGLQGGSSKPGEVQASKAPSGIGRKDLPGYESDNGVPSISSEGYLIMYVTPWGLSSSTRVSGFFNDSSYFNGYGRLEGQSGSGTSSPLSQRLFFCYSFTAPVDGIYFLSPVNNSYPFGSYQLFYQNSWTSTFGTYNLNPFTVQFSDSRVHSKAIAKGKNYFLGIGISILDSNFSTGRPYKYNINSIPVFIEPLGDGAITKQTNITINNNTWNGNIYVDNSNNLTYIYPEYTTINENNETVTNISNNPIIYNNETQQYYTYDSTTNNYYYITYNDTSATPAPSPSPEPTPTPSPGTDPTPTPTPGGGSGGGNGGSGGSGSSWWEKLLDNLGSAIVDGLLGAISAVLKLIFKLFSTILGWIIWLTSQVLTLFPFLPPGLGALLIGGVVVCFVIGIIKFIRG